MSRMQEKFACLALAAITLGIATPVQHVHAQGWRDKLKNAAKGKIEQAGNGPSSKPPADSAPAATSATTSAASSGDERASSTTSSAGSATARPGEGAWANYDFTPGEKPLFADDFSQDVVGNFPRRLEMNSGASEIVEWQGRRWLSSGVRSEFHVPLGQVLPTRYTIEFDMAGSGVVELTGDPKRTAYHHEATDEVLEFGDVYGGLKREADASSPTGFHTQDAPVHVAVQVDGDYVKAYVNEKRVANVPNAKLLRSNKLYVRLEGANEKAPMMIANLRVLAGGRALYDALAASGRVATQGIYFATGSDQLRPESSPTLKEIGTMLAAHPDLRLAIEGHTDNVGDAAANQTLSEQRAAAVRQALITTYHVDGARLTSRGLGASKPVAPNTTAEGRQTNRRVELVRGA